MLTIMVTGSHSLTAAEREWTETTMANIFRRYRPAAARLIHGYAHGVDRAAKKAAERLKFARIEGFNPDWDGPYKRGAGIARNAEMVRELNRAKAQGDDTLVIAVFPKGVITNGTKDSCHRAVSNGHRVEVYGLDDYATLLTGMLDFELDTSMILCVPRALIRKANAAS